MNELEKGKRLDAVDVASGICVWTLEVFERDIRRLPESSTKERVL